MRGRPELAKAIVDTYLARQLRPEWSIGRNVRAIDGQN
ncbi:hypothetical protein J2X71_002224 [Rhizobium sp. 1399]|jgi:hypothetical protein|nr:hypothetical protein [Rhizobium sp. 1399]